MKNLFVILTTLLVLAFAITMVVVRYGNEQEYTCTVKDSWIKGTGDDGQKYLFSCEENDIVFENTDQIFLGKFNSSDFYAMMEVGTTYQITTRGRRIPILSRYQNLIEMEEVEE